MRLALRSWTIAVILAISAPAIAAPPLAPSVAPQALGFDPAGLEKLDAAMAAEADEGHVAGMTTLLARHGKLVEFRAFGKASLARPEPMPRDAIFRIYSMTKPVTGVAMMILYEEGKWRLDDPVTKFIPEFANLKVMVKAGAPGKITEVEPVRRSPTMRELMSHTAGFGYGLETTHPVDKLYREKRVLGSSGARELIASIAEIPLKFQPGTDWAYSSGADIQGAIVERLSGMRLGEFFRRRIFAPLKMVDTGFSIPPDQVHRLAAIYVGDPATGRIRETRTIMSFPLPEPTKPPVTFESGGAGLFSTTADYARFCQMLLNGGTLDGARVLTPGSVRLMETNAIPPEVLKKGAGWNGEFNPTNGFGLDFAVDLDPARGGRPDGRNTISWGGAAGTWFWIDPTNDLFFIGMIQRFDADGLNLAEKSGALVYRALVHPER